MSLTVSNATLAGILDLLRNNQLGVCTARLFSNDYVPTPESQLTDFVEPEWPGYARYDLNPADWSDPVDDGDGTWSITTNTPLWLNLSSSDQTVYGVFLVAELDDDALIGACRFDAPLTIQVNRGKRVVITWREGVCAEPETPFPLTVPDLLSWYDGTYGRFRDVLGTLPAAPGDDVRRWEDRSPNLIHITRTGFTAPVASADGLTWAGAEVLFNSALPFTWTNGDWTVFVLHTPTAGAAVPRRIAEMRVTGPAGVVFAVNNRSGNDPAKVGYRDPTAWREPTTASEGAALVDVWQLDAAGGTGQLDRDGVVSGPVTYAPGTDTCSWFAIGGDGGGASFYIGEIRQVAFYRRLLTAGEVAGVLDYFASL